MAHQRFVKPEFFTDADVAEMPALYRIFFQGLWCQADRNGVLEDKPKQLKVRVMPYDDVDPEAVLKELCRRRFVVRYRVGRQRLLAIRSWEKNQAVHNNEKTGALPDPSKAEEVYEAVIPDGQLTTSQTAADGQLTPLPVLFPVPVPVPKPEAPAALPADAGVVGQLLDGLKGVYRQEKGYNPKDWHAGELRCLEQVLPHGVPEVLRRWRIGLRTPYPKCWKPDHLVRHWDAYAAEETGQAPRQPSLPLEERPLCVVPGCSRRQEGRTWSSRPLCMRHGAWWTEIGVTGREETDAEWQAFVDVVNSTAVEASP